MNSSRPYLIRALYEWIVENNCTPHLLVNSDFKGVQVPAGYASDGQIVLNISPTAVRHLDMDNQAVSFEGRFGGVPQRLYLPVAAIMAIYARENGQGMVFELEQPDIQPAGDADAVDTTPDKEPPKPGGRPSLKVVK
jgi:stringent starvation protein B